LRQGFPISEIQALLERQARWQKTQRALSWPEKIRMAERIRESARQLRGQRKQNRTILIVTGKGAEQRPR